MAAHPEFVVAHIFITDAGVRLPVFQHDGGQLLHLVPLRIVLSDFVDVGSDLVEVNLRQVDEQRFASHNAISCDGKETFNAALVRPANRPQAKFDLKAGGGAQPLSG